MREFQLLRLDNQRRIRYNTLTRNRNDKGNTMTRSELFKQYKVVAIRKAKRGETILATKNHGGSVEAVTLTADAVTVVSTIIERI